jgi:hypothetical protein
VTGKIFQHTGTVVYGETLFFSLSVSLLMLAIVYSRGGQLFSSAGHIEPFFVSRGPHLGHKAYLNATKIGHRGPYVAPS